jgi:hypothetical protein
MKFYHRLQFLALSFWMLKSDSQTRFAINHSSVIDYNSSLTAAFPGELSNQRALLVNNIEDFCDSSTKDNKGFKRYFDGMNSIYKGTEHNTCLAAHMECGWPAVKKTQKDLPLLVLSVGLEGAGHHLWTEILNEPVFDCVWINARHYRRDIADGVPRTTAEELGEGLKEQFKLRKESGMPKCKKIYDAEDSFPTGAIRKSGRIFCRPDLINVQKLDGILYNIKYLIIARNVTDTALSALRRNFFLGVDIELRTVEHTLTYIEAALRGVPCHRTFIAHYEHTLADPIAFINPLAAFLELDSNAKIELSKRLTRKGKFPSRKKHKLTQYSECKAAGLESNVHKCSNMITEKLDNFFMDRNYMWPTFAANGFDFIRQPL